MTYLLSVVFSSAFGDSRGGISKGGQAVASASDRRRGGRGRKQGTWARARGVEIREKSLGRTTGGEGRRLLTPLPSRRLLVPPMEEAALDP